VCWREDGREHPLEALYEARDAALQAAGCVRHGTIRPEDRASYEYAITALLQAVGELSHYCDLPLNSRVTSGPVTNHVRDATLVEQVGPRDFTHPN
jgi:hypothetical protein